MQVHIETFKSTGFRTLKTRTGSDYTYETFSVEVTIGTERRELPTNLQEQA